MEGGGKRRAEVPREPAEGIEIRPARAEEVEDLLPLMRAYCDFYESNPPDRGLREMAAALIADPEAGLLLIAREEAGSAVGFAALAWKWSSLNDLFVAPEARGRGIADGLIATCAARCRERGMPIMEWLTAIDNHRAQAVYERVGGVSEPFLEYTLDLRAAPDGPGGA
jgi:GNAT superfamily N-acetyltransferase